MMRRKVGAVGRRAADPLIRSVFGSFVLLAVIRLAEPVLFHPGYYAELSVHPFWIVVVLTAMQEGLFAGVAAAGMASLLMQWPARPLDMDITAHYATVAIVPIQWVLSAVLLGVYRQLQIVAEDRIFRENAGLREANDRMAEEIGRLDAALSRLELRAATCRAGDADAGWDHRGVGAVYAPWREPADRLTVFGAVDHGLELLQALPGGVSSDEPSLLRLRGGDGRDLFALTRALVGGSADERGWIALVLDRPDPAPEDVALVTQMAQQFEAPRDQARGAGGIEETNRNVVLLQSRKER